MYDSVCGKCVVYKKSLKLLSFDGPTRFSQIVEYVNRMVEYEVVNNKMRKYYILLIMTDGVIDDMEETIDQIVRATALPISIIIVGVGDSNFDKMETYSHRRKKDRLDADEKPLYSKKLGRMMERDIVQFVPFSNYRTDPLGLAKQTLEEVPRQLTSYMNAKRIRPVKQELANEKRVSFFDEDRRLLVQQLVSMGYTLERINTILDRGLPANSVELFITAEPNADKYNNVLAK